MPCGKCFPPCLKRKKSKVHSAKNRGVQLVFTKKLVCVSQIRQSLMRTNAENKRWSWGCQNEKEWEWYPPKLPVLALVLLLLVLLYKGIRAFLLNETSCNTPLKLNWHLKNGGPGRQSFPSHKNFLVGAIFVSGSVTSSKWGSDWINVSRISDW